MNGNVLVNREVVKDSISATLPNLIKFSGAVTIDDTLTRTAGDSIVVDTYDYVGDAVVVAEGEELPLKDIKQTSKTVTIESYGNGVGITDQQAQRKGDKLQDEIQNQLTLSIANAIDNKVYDVMKESTVTYDGTTGIISYPSIVNATALFGETEYAGKLLYIHSAQKAQLLLDKNFIRVSDLGDTILTKGVIGEIAGCQVIISDKIATTTKSGKTYYQNPIVAIGDDGEGAIELLLANDTTFEEQRGTGENGRINRTTNFYAYKDGIPYIKNAKRLVMMNVLKTEPATN